MELFFVRARLDYKHKKHICVRQMREKLIAKKKYEIISNKFAGPKRQTATVSIFHLFGDRTNGVFTLKNQAGVTRFILQ